MKFEKLPFAEVRECDSKTMKEAIERLLIEGADVRRPAKSPYQLKVTPQVSYYPSTGKTFVDGDPAARREIGLAALIAFLRTSNLLESS